MGRHLHKVDNRKSSELHGPARSLGDDAVEFLLRKRNAGSSHVLAWLSQFAAEAIARDRKKPYDIDTELLREAS